MLFMITQVHTPETCPIDSGGSDTLIDKTAQGVTVKGRWGDWSHHIIWYLVESDSLDAIQRLLDPGMKRSTCTIAPVTESPVQR